MANSKIILDQADAQKILNFLTSQPYALVYTLVPLLMNAERVDPPSALTEQLDEDRDAEFERQKRLRKGRVE